MASNYVTKRVYTMQRITTIIISFNEEKNISYAIDSVSGWTDVFVVDSGSTDQTVQIAEAKGAKVVHHDFENYAAQRNWAMNNDPHENAWILFLDADEVLIDELKGEMLKVLEENTFDGFYINRRFYFMEKWIKYGGDYPTWILRLFRKGKGVVERDVNEHLKVLGKVGYLKHDFADNNRNGISAWINKHTKYADMEALELFRYDQRKLENRHDERAHFFGVQAERKRWIREYIWNPLLPPLVRPFFYFFYCYFIKLGFLDGKAGFIYRVLQFWFYFLIDVKYLELKKKANQK